MISSSGSPLLANTSLLLRVRSGARPHPIPLVHVRRLGEQVKLLVWV
jgi:hypothetical protein